MWIIIILTDCSDSFEQRNSWSGVDASAARPSQLWGHNDLMSPAYVHVCVSNQNKISQKHL